MKTAPALFLLLLAGLCSAMARAEDRAPEVPGVQPPRADTAKSGTPGAELPKAETLPLFKQAAQASPRRCQFAIDHKAAFHTTPDGKSFYLLWLPEPRAGEGAPPLVVTLHGHGSWAFDEFFLWQPHLAKRGYGILALQWWFGQDERQNDYYLPREIHQIMESALERLRAPPRSVLLHGFSRGSANIYGVTAFDRKAQKNYVLLTVANAGKPGSDFPVNADIENGKFGAQPFRDTHWVLYAGAKDPHPDRDGIAGMRKARDWVKLYGGTVERLMEDPNGGHGGFHRNPDNLNTALDIFARLLAGPKHEGGAAPSEKAPRRVHPLRQ